MLVTLEAFLLDGWGKKPEAPAEPTAGGSSVSWSSYVTPTPVFPRVIDDEEETLALILSVIV